MTISFKLPEFSIPSIAFSWGPVLVMFNASQVQGEDHFPPVGTESAIAPSEEDAEDRKFGFCN